LLKPGREPKALEAKFVPYINKEFRQFKSDGDGAIYHLQPLKSIHLYSHLMLEAEPNGDGKSVYLLAAIAIFVIIIAWINYINLATARSIGRAKEVGVRKNARGRKISTGNAIYAGSHAAKRAGCFAGRCFDHCLFTCFCVFIRGKFKPDFIDNT
jgi:hypothetical protein